MKSVEGVLDRRKRVMGKSPLFYDEPLHLVRGEGVSLYDADGQRYLDCYNNIPVVGHCNRRVVEAMYRQSQILNVHSRYLSENIVAYAERLLGTFKNKFGQVMFTCSGSEANDQALRIARMTGGGRGIICTDFGYHGNTSAVNEVSPLFHRQRQYFTEVRFIPFPQTYRPLDGLEGGALVEAYVSKVRDAIDSLEEAGIGVAGMIFCSVFANEGLPNVPSGVLSRVTAMVREAGGLIISDEVQAGFGRTGSMWGHELMGFSPDLVTMGKPMGNGYPTAAVVGHSELLDRFRERVFYFNTFASAHVAAAAANAVLDVIDDEGLLGNATRTGNLVRRGFGDLAQRFECIGDIRGSGLWIGIEFVKDRVSKVPASEEVKALVNRLRYKGVLVSRMGPYENVLKIRPPLVFNEENAAELLDAVEGCMSEMFI